VVTLTAGMTVLGGATAIASGAWSFTPTGLAQGAQTITASETDLAGNIGSTAIAPRVTSETVSGSGRTSLLRPDCCLP